MFTSVIRPFSFGAKSIVGTRDGHSMSCATVGCWLCHQLLRLFIVGIFLLSSDPAFAQSSQQDDEVRLAKEYAELQDDMSDDERRQLDVRDYYWRGVTLEFSGQVVDEDKQPIADANVFFVRRREAFFPDPAFRKDYFKTQTDIQGNFKFQVNMPVLFRPGVHSPRSLFQIAVQKPGYGIAWKRRAFVYPLTTRPDEQLQGTDFYLNEPLELGVMLSPEADISGTIRNSEGEPIEGATIQFLVTSDGVKFGSPPMTSSCRYRPGSYRSEDGGFGEAYYIQQELGLKTQSDSDGKYMLRGAPRDASFSLFFDYRADHQPKSLHINTYETGEKTYGRVVGYQATLDHTFETPNSIQVKVVDQTNGKPLEGAKVLAVGAGLRGGADDVTGSDGLAKLKFIRTPFSISVVPDPAGLQSAKEVSVESDAESQTLLVSLPRLATVELSVVNRKGQPIEAASLESSASANGPFRYQHSRETFADFPVTDKQGRLLAALPPGQHYFRLRDLPLPYRQADGPKLVPATLKMGQSASVKFVVEADPTLRGPKEPLAIDSGDERINRVASKWREVRQQWNTGAIKFRGRSFIRMQEQTVDELLEQLRPLYGLSQNDCLENLAEILPAYKTGLSERELYYNPYHIKEVVHWNPGKRTATTDVHVRHLLEEGAIIVKSELNNGQINIGPNNRAYDSPKSIHLDPAQLIAEAPQGAEIELVSGEQFETIAINSDEGSVVIEFDAESGFVWAIIRQQRLPGFNFHRTAKFQFAPRLTEQGVSYPGIRIDVRPDRRGGATAGIKVFQEANERLPDDLGLFVVPVEQGCTIVAKSQNLVTRATRNVPDVWRELERLVAMRKARSERAKAEKAKQSEAK